MMGNFYNMGWGGGLGFGFGWIFMLLFWGLVIWAIIYLAKNVSHNNNLDYRDRQGDKSMDILKERYAKGEISKEDFERMKKDLQ
jgi:putative membrane protein